MMKLPGEIRNSIYAEALKGMGDDKEVATTKDGAILIGHSHHKVPESSKLDQPYVSPLESPFALMRPWRQPGLLLVSKDIRREAMDVYYDSNKFELIIHPMEMLNVAVWLKRYHNGCGSEKMFNKVNFQLFATPYDGDVWFCLSKMIYEMAINYKSVEEETERWTEFFRSDKYHDYDEGGEIISPVVVKSAVMAGRAKVSYDEFIALHQKSVVVAAVAFHGLNKKEENMFRKQLKKEFPRLLRKIARGSAVLGRNQEQSFIV